MRVFRCDHCSRPVFFENTFCSNCGHKLAYLADLKLVASLDPADRGSAGDGGQPALWTSPVPRAEGRTYRLCDNYTKYGVCNWAIPSDDPNPLCNSCRLTQVIPDLSVAGNQEAWARLEAAKRRMVYSLMELRLPIHNRIEDPANGLEFRFLGEAPGGPKVLTG